MSQVARDFSPARPLYSKSKSKTASPPRPLSPPQSSLHGLLQGLRWSGSPQCCPSQCQGSATPVSCGAMPGLRAPLVCGSGFLPSQAFVQQEQEQDRQPASAPQPAPRLPPWPPAGLEVVRLPTLLPHAVPGQCHTCNLRRHARSEGAAGLELPEPVLTSDMMPHFEDVAIIPNPGERAEAMRQLINRLPTANRLLLQYMFKHMGHIIARHLVSRPSLSSPYPRWTLGKDVTNPQPPASCHTSKPFPAGHCFET
ncbi:uncharacterized protein LOC127003217 isoform X2 [Eriocheir sinensis]|uniref:uncharacterized protein LOC127003217 isoform X1 n=1 Tax=Eriocheir sinensis TaxID=95602 RepID=UPI0021CA47FA|nr:uncharacterized protein LOC127003217 isoform X1 [Eriocheir sinensis]XP_050725548.1 uncharacterized protein LOC127003217 isoform X2 [Eriocheir sinensis]